MWQIQPAQLALGFTDGCNCQIDKEVASSRGLYGSASCVVSFRQLYVDGASLASPVMQNV